MEMTPTLVAPPQTPQTQRQTIDVFSFPDKEELLQMAGQDANNLGNGEIEDDELPEFFPAFWLDHTQLPDEDGTFVKNFQEHPQASLLSNTILPVLKRIHPDEQFAIGQDCGVYWRVPEPTEPLLKYVIAPDWFYVPEVPPLIKGKIRRSYVMWQELILPTLVVEFVSGNGDAERDRTPDTGKFWIYERGVRPLYYAIYEVMKAQVEVYHLEDGRFAKITANERGHYPIALLGVELGIWQGKYEHVELSWLRWWDAAGNLLLTGDERAERESQRAERLAAQLRALGIEPEA